MEETYENVECDNLKVSPNQRGPRSSNRRFHGAAVLCLGLLSASLLAALVGLTVHYLVSARGSAAEPSTANMTEHLWACERKCSSLTEEGDQLKARIKEVTEELHRLQSSSKEEKTCPAGWTMFSGVCYLLSEWSSSWDKGRQDCRGRGADLVVIGSTEELRFLYGFTEIRAWIGLTDSDEEGIWKWIDGTEALMTHWSPKQPDNGGGDPQWGEEDCAHINAYLFAWNDLSCQTSLHWICEKMA
ncbi:CD209 antigen-like protein C [Pempheris klunzingeri]|uniref:CD209 antigen-like protein C n=1 Tax=Pempheris klunzingeri TaxID=3127111 RepID=UPI003980AE07